MVRGVEIKPFVNTCQALVEFSRAYVTFFGHANEATVGRGPCPSSTQQGLGPIQPCERTAHI